MAVTLMSSLHLYLPAQDLQEMVFVKLASGWRRGHIRLLTSHWNSGKFLISGEGVSLPSVL